MNMRLFKKEKVKNNVLKVLQGALILSAPFFIRNFIENKQQQEKQQVKTEVVAKNVQRQEIKEKTQQVVETSDKRNIEKFIETTSFERILAAAQKPTVKKKSQTRKTNKILAQLKAAPAKNAVNRHYNRQKITLPSTANKFSTKNGQRLCQIENKIVAMIALMENYEPYPYMSGGAATIGYGSCYKPDGSPVTMNDAPIDKTTARLYTQAHLRKDVFPAIEKYVTKDLDDSQLMAVSAFIYAVGSANFAGLGYDENGRKRQPSEFLKAVNSGKSDFECARKLSGWKTAGGGILHEGLLKRRWLEMALYCHRLEPQELLEMSPGGHFNLSVRDLYKYGRADKDGYYTPKMDEATMRKVMQVCKSGKRRLKDIIDEKAQQDLFAGSTLALNDFAQRYAALQKACRA